MRFLDFGSNLILIKIEFLHDLMVEMSGRVSRVALVVQVAAASTLEGEKLRRAYGLDYENC